MTRVLEITSYMLTLLLVGGNVLAGTTERVSVSSAGLQADTASYFSSISGDGRYIAFASHASNLVSDDNNNVVDIFVRDRISQTTERVSLATGGGESNADSSTPGISADGRYVVFGGHQPGTGRHELVWK